MGFFVSALWPQFSFQRLTLTPPLCSFGSLWYSKESNSCWYSPTPKRIVPLRSILVTFELPAILPTHIQPVSHWLLPKSQLCLSQICWAAVAVVIEEEECGATRTQQDDDDGRLYPTLLVHCVPLPNTDNFCVWGFRQKCVSCFVLSSHFSPPPQQSWCLAASHFLGDAILLPICAYPSLSLTPALFRYLLSKGGWHSYWL